MRTCTLLISFVVFVLVFFCNAPLDPMKNYDKSDIGVIDTSTTEYPVGDSVSLDLELRMPHLMDYIIFSINGKDSTIICRYDPDYRDTLELVKSFQNPGNFEITFTVFLKNGESKKTTHNISIQGSEPKITSNPPVILYVNKDSSCTLSVVSEGSVPIHYQWLKNDDKLEDDTLSQLIITGFTLSDTGIYTCVVTSDWGVDTSRPSVLLYREIIGKTVYWNQGNYEDSVHESDSLVINLESLYTNESGEKVTFSALEYNDRCYFSGDSQFVFKSFKGDSGTYTIPVSIKGDHDEDDALFHINVIAKYCTLSVSSENGKITVNPKKEFYRPGEKVSLTADPDSGYEFFEWYGDISGSDSEIELIIDSSMSVSARFWPQASTECYPIENGYLNSTIKEVSAGAQRPKLLCPEPGLYENGTVKISGKVRFVIQ